jgi:hypothetical protein
MWRPATASAVTAGSIRRTSTAVQQAASTLASPSDLAARFNWFASSRLEATWSVPFRFVLDVLSAVPQ